MDNSQSETESKIRSFASLPVGWDFGDGGPISDAVIEKAIDVLAACLPHDMESNAFPGYDGILLSFYGGSEHHDHCIDLDIQSDLSIDLTHDVGIGADYDTVEEIENVDLETAKQRIASIA